MHGERSNTRDYGALAAYEPGVKEVHTRPVCWMCVRAAELPGNFGEFGGRYVPETLVEAHRELEEAYRAAKADPEFMKEVKFMRAQYIGGPTPLYHAKRLTERCGGAQVYLKREELAFTGAHKINNAVGQALLAVRLGKKRIIAETVQRWTAIG